MKTKITVLTLCALLLALCASAEAQQPGKVPRIGFLSASRPQPEHEAFRQGLRELGYVEGQNIVIEWRFAEGNLDRISQHAAELVRLTVVIVAGGPSASRAAKEATSTIPIVMAFDNDPVGNRFVASLARPGGNITGLSTLAPEISGKQLELLKEIVPRLLPRGRLGDFDSTGQRASVKRDGTCRRGVRSEASIHRRTRP